MTLSLLLCFAVFLLPALLAEEDRAEVLHSGTIDITDRRVIYSPETGALKVRFAFEGAFSPVFSLYRRRLCYRIAMAEEKFRRQSLKKDPTLQLEHPETLEERILKFSEALFNKHNVQNFPMLLGNAEEEKKADACASSLWMSMNEARAHKALIQGSLMLIDYRLTIDCPMPCKPTTVYFVGIPNEVVDPRQKIVYLEHELNALRWLAPPSVFREQTEMNLINAHAKSLPAIINVQLGLPQKEDAAVFVQSFPRNGFDQTVAVVGREDKFSFIYAPSLNQPKLEAFFTRLVQKRHQSKAKAEIPYVVAV